jgi:hypothetical protein
MDNCISELDERGADFQCEVQPGANHSTSEFTTTTAALLERFSKIEEYIFVFKNALGYSWRCKFLQRWRCNSLS